MLEAWQAEARVCEKKLNAHFSELYPKVEKACLDVLPDRAWELLAEGVQEVAVKFFGKEEEEEEGKRRRLLALERQEWLRARRDARVNLQKEEFALAKAKLITIEAQMKRLARSRARAHREYLEDELRTAWRARNLAQVNVLSRQLAGTKIGAKHRRVDQPLCSRPSVVDWTEHLSRPGQKGGLALHVMDLENYRKQHEELLEEEGEVARAQSIYEVKQHYEEAKEDL